MGRTGSSTTNGDSSDEDYDGTLGEYGGDN